MIKKVTLFMLINLFFIFSAYSENLVFIPGFEASETDVNYVFHRTGSGYALETAGGHSGNRSIRLETCASNMEQGAICTLPRSALGTNCQLIVSGWSKAQEVSGARDVHYALCADINYADGSILRQVAMFSPGTHDWEYSAVTVRVDKAVTSIFLGAKLQVTHTGTAWFDDLFVGQYTNGMAPYNGDSFQYTVPTNTAALAVRLAALTNRMAVLSEKIARAEQANRDTINQRISLAVAGLFSTYIMADAERDITTYRYMKLTDWIKLGTEEVKKRINYLPEFEMSECEKMVENAISEVTNTNNLQESGYNRTNAFFRESAQVGISSNGCFTLDGKPTFFYGIYAAAPQVQGVILKSLGANLAGWFHLCRPLNNDWKFDDDERSLLYYQSYYQSAATNGLFVSPLIYPTGMPKWLTDATPGLLVGQYWFRPDFAYDIDHPIVERYVTSMCANASAQTKDFPNNFGYNIMGEEWCDPVRYPATGKRYADWLTGRFNGNVSNLNAALGKSYKNFNEAASNTVLETKGQSYCWNLFNQSRLTQFNQWIIDGIRQGDPSPRSRYSTCWPGLGGALGGGYHSAKGVNMEDVISQSSVPGWDSGALPYEAPEAEGYFERYYPYSWPQQERGKYNLSWRIDMQHYDFARSVAPRRPIFNPELHVIMSPLVLSSDFIRLNLWLRYLHGMGAHLMWWWGRSGVNPTAGLDFTGNMLTQPQLLEGWGRTMQELQRLAEYITLFPVQERRVRILYSEASAIINGTNNCDVLSKTYESMYFLDYPVGFITEKMIAAGGLNDCALLVVPTAQYVGNEAVAGVTQFMGQGGKVAMIGSDNFRYDEYGRERARDFTTNAITMVGTNASDWRVQLDGLMNAAGVKRPVRILSLDGRPIEGLEMRVAQKDGSRIIYLLNLSRMPVGIKFSSQQGGVHDLIHNAEIVLDQPIRVDTRGVMLLAASTNLTAITASAGTIVTLGNLSQTYDGSPKSATATTVPAGLPVTLTYNGSTTAPSAAGSYAVVATVNSGMYQGTASGTLRIMTFVPVSTNSLTAYWKMDGFGGVGLSSNAVLDSAGTNTGIVYDGVSAVSTGYIDGALSFDGFAGRIHVPPAEALKYRGGNMTMSAWIKIGADEANTGYIISKPWNGSGRYNYYLMLDADRKLSLYLGGSNAVYTSSSGALSTEAWHQVGFTLGADKTMRIYLDGVEVVSAAHNITNWTPIDGDINLPLAIGSLYPYPYGSSWVGNSAFSFRGMIDDMRLYNRALSAGEMWTIYQAIAPVITTQPADRTVTVGQTATFSVTASGTAPLSYQWRKNGVNISGATSASYTTPATIATDNGAVFSVVVVNAVGNDVTSREATLTVKDNQTITFPSIPAQLTTNKVTLAATASSGLPVSFAVASGPAQITGGIFSFTGAGSVRVVASQAGNTNWNAANPVTNTITVSKATAIVTLGNLGHTYDGTQKSATATTVPAGLTVTFTYNGTATAPSDVGSYAVVATVNSGMYQGTARGTLRIMTIVSVATNDLISYWKMDGLEGVSNNAVLDSAGTNTGIAYDGVSAVSTGHIDGALSFDGFAGRIHVPPAEALKYRGGNMSMSAWIKIGADETNTGYIISKPWNGSGRYNYYLMLDADRKLSLYLRGSNGVYLCSSTALSAEAWHQVGFTLGTDKTMRIYLDGIEVVSATHSITNWTPIDGDINLPLAIGSLYPYPYGSSWKGNSAFSFRGMIDDMRLYNRALSADEMWSIYQQAVAPAGGVYGMSGSAKPISSFSGACADYDGDRKADFAVYDEAAPSTGSTSSLSGANDSLMVTDFNGLGGPGCVSVSADYDGDGKIDPAVYRESNGVWAFLLSSANYEVVVVLSQTLGGVGYIPVPADYDGDGLADPAVKSKSGNEWIVMFSSGGYTPVSPTSFE